MRTAVLGLVRRVTPLLALREERGGTGWVNTLYFEYAERGKNTGFDSYLAWGSGSHP